MTCILPADLQDSFIPRSGANSSRPAIAKRLPRSQQISSMQVMQLPCSLQEHGGVLWKQKSSGNRWLDWPLSLVRCLILAGFLAAGWEVALIGSRSMYTRSRFTYKFQVACQQASPYFLYLRPACGNIHKLFLRRFPLIFTRRVPWIFDVLYCFAAIVSLFPSLNKERPCIHCCPE
jgi:hypothetical protein